MINAILEYIEFLENVKKTSKNTAASYKRDLMKLYRWMNEKGIHSFDKVSKKVLESYIASLQSAKLSPATVSRNIAAIRSFFIYAKEEKIVDSNPATELKAPKVSRKTPSSLSAEDVSELLKQPDVTTAKGARDKAMLELLYATGIHVSELINLRLSDLNLKTSYILCQEHNRKIPFGDEAGIALSAYIGQERDKLLGDNVDEQSLFVNCKGTPMSRQGFWKLLKGYAKKTNIAVDITPHTLRHSFATHMIEKGVDLKSVQEMLGHSDISTTNMYVREDKGKVWMMYQNNHAGR